MSVGSIHYASGAYAREMMAAKYAAPERRSLPTAETTVSISEAARSRLQSEAAPDAGEAKAASGGYRLPEGWLRRDFSPDILAEARARLAERRAAPGIGDGNLPNEVSGLPLAPENQALMEKMRTEMRELGKDINDPVKLQRFNELMNLQLALQRTGWQKPMTEEDLSRELSVTQAVGMLQSREPRPASAPDKGDTGIAPQDFDPLAGWRKRWAQDGRTMPPVESQVGQSLWQDLAKGAGIGEEEFLKSAREFAQTHRGEALTQKIEGFISERYAALAEAENKAA